MENQGEHVLAVVLQRKYLLDFCKVSGEEKQ